MESAAVEEESFDNDIDVFLLAELEMAVAADDTSFSGSVSSSSSSGSVNKSSSCTSEIVLEVS